MNRELRLAVNSKDFDKFKAEVRSYVRPAALKAAEVVQQNVIDLTPRHTGKMQSEIYIGTLGEDYVIYGAGGPAMGAMEGNPPGRWTKMPPFKPLQMWAQSKLGLAPNEAAGAARAIQRKILRDGIQIPLKHDKRGGMFRRTYEKMVSTSMHFVVFMSYLKQMVTMGRK